MRHANAVTAAVPLVGTRRSRRQDRFASLLARLRAGRIDRELAGGVEPWLTPVHAIRARRLTDERPRRRLARSLERLVEQAEEPWRHSLSSVVRPSRARVREARPLLLTLASRLRSGAPVHPRGVAALRTLLIDGGGPVYTEGAPDTLRRRLQAIEYWLETEPRGR